MTGNNLIFYMKEALLEAARQQDSEGEKDIPVGCVVVLDGKIIAKAHNTRERDRDVLGHAEINAIREAQRVVGDWRLSGCSLFVTLEPCAMCAGAIKAARMDSVFFGAYDTKEGACGSLHNILYPSVNFFGGILEAECSEMLKKFFTEIR